MIACGVIFVTGAVVQFISFDKEKDIKKEK